MQIKYKSCLKFKQKLLILSFFYFISFVTFSSSSKINNNDDLQSSLVEPQPFLTKYKISHFSSEKNKFDQYYRLAIQDIHAETREEKQKQAYAQYKIGKMYRASELIQNQKEAYKFLSMSAYQGYVPSLYQLAILRIQRQNNSTDKTTQDFLKNAADLGYERAQDFLTFQSLINKKRPLLESYEILDYYRLRYKFFQKYTSHYKSLLNDLKDFKQAILEYNQAKSTENIFECERKVFLIIQHFEMLAEQATPVAQFICGLIYRHSRETLLGQKLFVNEEHKKKIKFVTDCAIKWLEKGADRANQTDINLQFDLANMFNNSLLIPDGIERGHYWFERASLNNY